MTDQYIELIGTIAAICTTFCFGFQCFKVYKTKSTKDISLIMYVVFTVGTANWIAYGTFYRTQFFTVIYLQQLYLFISLAQK